MHTWLPYIIAFQGNSHSLVFIIKVEKYNDGKIRKTGFATGFHKHMRTDPDIDHHSVHFHNFGIAGK